MNGIFGSFFNIAIALKRVLWPLNGAILDGNNIIGIPSGKCQ